MSSIAVLQPQRPVIERVSHLRAQLESSLDEHLSSTLLLRERAAPLTVPTGIAALDELTGGLPRGALSEFSGPTSSGRTGAMLSSLAGATRRNEVCALVDASDSFDPASAAAAGIDLERLLWVRCSRETRSRESRKPKLSFPFSDVLEQVLKIADLLLQAGGFGMVVLDLGDLPGESVRRIPLTSWFRFRRAVEPTATVLLLIEQEACAKTCASLVLRFEPQAVRASNSSASSAAPETRKLQPMPLHKQMELPANNPVSHAVVLHGMRLHAAIARSWNQRKPPQSVGTDFQLSALSG